jgi:hypothetical protein
MDEGTAWVADELPVVDVPHHGPEWPEGGPDPFGLQHDETVRLYWARGRPSLGYAGTEPHLAVGGLREAIPMGYTSLVVLEKLAVVSDGRRLRIWPHGPERVHSGRLQAYQLLLPPDGADYLLLGTWWPYDRALAAGVELSARTGGPLVLCRVLADHYWH